MMCQSVAILESIKKMRGQGGMTKAQLQLAEEQARDIEAMTTEIKEVKADVAELKTSVATIDGKLDLLIKQSENKPFMQAFKDLIACRGFWIVLALIVIGIYGIDLSGIRGLIGQ